MARDPDADLKFTSPEADRQLAEAPSLWSYLPRLLRYPLRGYALGVTVVLGVLFVMSIHVGVFGIAMLGLLVAWLGFYLLEIVGDTASGHRGAQRVRIWPHWTATGLSDFSGADAVVFRGFSSPPRR